MVYRFPIVDTFNGKNCTMKIPAITASREPGIRLKTIGEMIRTARLTRPTMTASRLTEARFPINADSFSMVSIGFIPAG